MTITEHEWPPSGYQTDFWPPNWLREEVGYPGSGRPSRLLSHSNVPFLATISTDEDLETALKKVAGLYVQSVFDLLEAAWQPLDPLDSGPDVKPLMPGSWHDALVPGGAPPHPLAIRWLDIWPTIGTVADAAGPRLASWNLSRQENGDLPAVIEMTAAETYAEQEEILSYSFGVRVPMTVETAGDDIRVIIRSITVEYPAEGYFSVTEALASRGREFREPLAALLSAELGTLNVTTLGELIALSAAGAFVYRQAMNAEELLFSFAPAERGATPGLRLTLSSKAAAAVTGDGQERIRQQFPTPQSFEVVSTFDLLPSPVPGGDGFAKLVSTEVCPLVSHAANPGAADVFVQTPPGWVDPNGRSYLYTRRRPTRDDTVLETYRSARDIGPAAGKRLESDGFAVRRCPDYVPADRDAGPGVKSVPLPGGQDPVPRRNDFSAIMAYCNSLDFFQLLGDIGLPPSLFAVRTEEQVDVLYRYGIFPGPGRNGRTINAQVALDCAAAAQGIKPRVQIRLALATLNRWSRPPNPHATPSSHPDRRFLRPEPLGIAASGRWMLHEFGHFLTAARLGKLEFDFAHSAGDALAAVWYDPYSQLSEESDDVSETFRGFTYPFVFTTRRHDRSPLLGWGWYGALNRSVIAAPPARCETLKGYLTEQILSSSIFRLYRALGGDTVHDSNPDRYIRYRASFMTLFLLIRAIAGFTQSPSKAEMLELGIEEASLSMTTPVDVPAPPHGALDTVPAPGFGDQWSGGVSHKVVRWAFEAQGMFVKVVKDTTNGPGQAAPVDIFVMNGRPQKVVLSAGTTHYGPGSYAPVSLDWTGARAWMVDHDQGFVLGNRGQQPAIGVRARMWLAVLQGDMAQDRWDLGDNMDWIASHSFAQQLDLAPGEEVQIQIPAEICDAIENAGTGIGLTFGILLEVSCNDDLANSDPQALLAAAIPDGDSPPVKPRALTDLVAGDNNLGFMLREF